MGSSTTSSPGAREQLLDLVRQAATIGDVGDQFVDIALAVEDTLARPTAGSP